MSVACPGLILKITRVSAMKLGL